MESQQFVDLGAHLQTPGVALLVGRSVAPVPRTLPYAWCSPSIQHHHAGDTANRLIGDPACLAILVDPLEVGPTDARGRFLDGFEDGEGMVQPNNL